MRNKVHKSKRYAWTYTCNQLTEISWIVICRAVEAQVLQIRDEVRDCALVYALTLTEDVQLVNEEHMYRVINIVLNLMTP